MQPGVRESRRHDEWAGSTVTRAIGDPLWTIEHADGQISHISKDWSRWTGEGWPTGFTIHRPDGSTFPVDEGTSATGGSWSSWRTRTAAVRLRPPRPLPR